MNLLGRIPFVSFLFHKNGTGKEAVAVAAVPEAAEPPGFLERGRPDIPLEETICDLERFVSEQTGVEDAFVKVRRDRRRLIRVRIEVCPAPSYKKYKRKHSKYGFTALAGRLAGAVSRATGIPQEQIAVKRNLKIPYRSGSARSPSLL